MVSVFQEPGATRKEKFEPMRYCSNSMMTRAHHDVRDHTHSSRSTDLGPALAPLVRHDRPQEGVGDALEVLEARDGHVDGVTAPRSIRRRCCSADRSVPGC